MTFAGTDLAYDRFMGRYSSRLAPLFADFAGIEAAMTVLDVGCGPGALTTELVKRVGAANVAAVDPTDGFVAAARERQPGVDVRRATAEDLPFEDESFDAALAQLVVHFMTDPVAGVREMARVTRSGGVVAACVWDHTGGDGPIAVFWAAVDDVDPSAGGETGQAGTKPGDLVRIFRDAGLDEVEEEPISVTVEHATFDEWWAPFTLGVGPIGVYLSSVDADRQEAVRESCRARLPQTEPLRLTARAWAARARV